MYSYTNINRYKYCNTYTYKYLCKCIGKYNDTYSST